jgi:hypothetical protein
MQRVERADLNWKYTLQSTYLEVHSNLSFPPKRRLTQDLHSATSQKTIFFNLSVSSHVLKKRFSEEIITYFPLIRHWPHRKRRIEKFFAAVGTSLPRCNLSMIRGCTDKARELLYDWRFTANHFVLTTNPLRLTTSTLYFPTEHLRL